MLDKLFNWGKKKPGVNSDPGIQFGRYSDNNKPPVKVSRWTEADNHFREKRFADGFDAFFDYLRDDVVGNVVYERNGAEGRFEFYQGSKIVRGDFDQDKVRAEVTLAKMPQPSVPVMRRLLEMNFNLYYTRFAMENDRICMRFDSDIKVANPSKLYYGLKELATKADKQDDLLVQDFSTLQTTDSEHIAQVDENEKEVKFVFFQKWISETLDKIASVDADKFSGGIAYMLLALVYRIDYLLSPEGQLLNELEKIAGIYFRKDDRPVVEKNRDMIEEFRKLKARPKEDIFRFLFRSKYTFAIGSPQTYKTIADSIISANQNTTWYRDNNHHFIASQIIEYGISYCQYSYSLPRVITEFFHLYMMVNYADFFAALGYGNRFFSQQTSQLNPEPILAEMAFIQDRWKQKFPGMEMKKEAIRFDSTLMFNLTFSSELAALNMDGSKS